MQKSCTKPLWFVPQQQRPTHGIQWEYQRLPPENFPVPSGTDAAPCGPKSRFFSFSAPTGRGIMKHMQQKERAMFVNFTAKYTKISSGYLGQLVEWPEVVTEGKDLEDCRAMLRDALNEMILAYKEQKKEIPPGNALIEQPPVEISDFRQTA